MISVLDLGLQNMRKSSKLKIWLMGSSVSIIINCYYIYQKLYKISHWRAFILWYIFSRMLVQFIALVDQILLSHLIQLSCSSVVQFVEQTVEQSNTHSRDALFYVSLMFSNKNGNHCSHFFWSIITITLKVPYIIHLVTDE